MIEGRTLTEKSTTFISMVAKKATNKDDGTLDLVEDAVTEDGELYSHVRDFKTELEADNRTYLWYFDDENNTVFTTKEIKLTTKDNRDLILEVSRLVVLLVGL